MLRADYLEYIHDAMVSVLWPETEPISDREQRDRAKPAQVTVLRTGLSGTGLERALRASEVREAERLRRLPKLNSMKPGRDTEGVWF